MCNCDNFSENPNLGNQIDDFFQVYNGPMEIENIIVAGGVRYYVNMEIYSQDDFDKEAEGIHILEFDTEEAISSKYYMPYNEDDDGAGLYYQHSAEKRDDIKWIDGRSWKYTYYDRTLTAADLSMHREAIT